jgi:hypothetical protein
MRGIWNVGVKLCWPFLQSPYRAAETYLYLATSPEVAAQTGRYWEHSTQKASSDASHDRELRRRIRDYAERATAR